MHARLDEVLQAAVDAGDVPCVVATAADDDGTLYEGAAGTRSRAAEPVTPDTTFRIASMTKMVATVAALQQVERGNLDLDEPIATYLPDFARVQVLEGFDGDTPRLRPPASQATVRQLVTHTTGLTYWFWNADCVRWQECTGTPTVMSGDESSSRRRSSPTPGRRWEYGINTDWLGRVVEAASGQPLDAYLAEHILGPLGMTSTAFRIDDAQRANLVPIHLRGEDGTLGAVRAGLAARPRLVGRRPRAVLDPARIPALPAHAPRRGQRGRRHAARARHGPGGVHEPDRRHRRPARDPDRRPVLLGRLQRRSGPQVGARAAAQHAAEAGDARAGQRRVGGPVQHPLLGRPGEPRDRRDLLPDAAVRGARGSSRSTSTSSRRSTRRCPGCERTGRRSPPRDQRPPRRRAPVARS